MSDLDINYLIEKYDKPLVEMQQNEHWVNVYPLHVLTGKIPACRQIKQACERHFKDLERSEGDWEYHLSLQKVKQFISFCNSICHTSAEWAGKPLELASWQIWTLGSLFGWVTKEPDKNTNRCLRRFKTFITFVARKNGKSLMASAASLYSLYFDGEYGGQVASAATTREQAKIVFRDADLIAKKSQLKAVSKFTKNKIEVPSTNSRFEPLSSDAMTLDGLSLSFCVVDEVHAHKDGGALWSVLDTSTGARQQSVMFAISTAGVILQGIGTDLWSLCEQIIDPEIDFDDDTVFGALYTVDKEDQESLETLANPVAWAKANPCLGISKKVSEMERHYSKAKATPSFRAEFLTKHLNVFVNGMDTWLNIQELIECRDPDFNINDYKGYEAYIGLDLAQKHDLTAISLIIPTDDGGIAISQKHYIPEQTVANASSSMAKQYRRWADEGCLEITKGATTDYRIIKQELIRLCEEYNVIEIGYDPYSAAQLAIDLEDLGLTMIEVRQGALTLSEPSKQLEALIKDRKIKYKQDGCFEYCCANAMIKIDQNDNIKVIRDPANTHVSKIDSVIALITGLSRTILKEANRSVYESREILML